MSKTNVHIVPHTHWDREWYFTTSRSTIYLVKHVKEVLETLENNPDFGYYLLDAQTSLLEDYLKYCPEDEERIKKLVKAEQLMTGPWYTQTDQLVISQESVVRNLLYGTRKAEEWGHSMRIGYVPDAFGQGGNMPQIYKNFDIRRFLFWRGVADNRLKQTEFIWEGSDGTQMTSVQIPFGYYYGGNLPEDDADIETYLEEQLGKLEAKASTSHVYYPNGFDQAPIRKNLPELIKRFSALDDSREYHLDSPETFFDSLEQETESLPVIKGELTEGKHSRIHKSIFSCRADLKQQNNEIENYLVNTVEPILVISHSLGNRYPKQELEEIWKLMFENAAHDSIGGCNSDTTNRDVNHRYKLARDKAGHLLDLHLRLITERIDFKENLPLTVFNPLVYPYQGVISFSAYLPEGDLTIYDNDGNEVENTIRIKRDVTDYVLKQTIRLNPSKEIYIPERVFEAEILINVKDLPALGYQSLSIGRKEKADICDAAAADFIENEFYEIRLAADNTLTVKDKKSGKEYPGQMLFEDNGDDGDSYNYSPPKKDWIIRSDDAVLESATVQSDALESRMSVVMTMTLPYDLKERAKKQAFSEFKIKADVVLRKGESFIRFDAAFDNQVLSHRICVLFDTGLVNQFSVADELFGTIRRLVYLPENEVWEEEKWEEKPISIEPMQTFVAAGEKNGGMAVFTQGVREYEFVGTDYRQIRLTLFRTFGFMGKDDLLYRPGRASGESIVETPDAQLQGTVNATFALHLYQGCFDQAGIARLAKEYLTTFPVYQSADFLNGRMIYAYRDEEKKNPSAYQLLEAEEMTSIVSAVKMAEDGDGYMIRLYNPCLDSDTTIAASLTEGGAFVRLDEKTADEAATSLKPHQFKTIKRSR